MTKIIFVTVMYLVTHKAGAKHEHLFNKSALGINQKSYVSIGRFRYLEFDLDIKPVDLLFPYFCSSHHFAIKMHFKISF